MVAFQQGKSIQQVCLNSEWHKRNIFVYLYTNLYLLHGMGWSFGKYNLLIFCPYFLPNFAQRHIFEAKENLLFPSLRSFEPWFV